ncbi:peptidoglycan DD-metalloendopeptidase family protein [Actinomadura vinacea]|uniref:peptidoglycan DD-metalloendopeptidase family protein n=1 Tax=Actinomadura vinacea TaxID=115336 RepID=UPI0031DC9D56
MPEPILPPELLPDPDPPRIERLHGEDGRTGRKRRRPQRPGSARRGRGPHAMPKQSGMPRQRVRGARGPADRLSTGALVFSIVVGLSLLAVVESSLLEGSTFGTPGPAGSDLVLQSPGSQAKSPSRGPAPTRPSAAPQPGNAAPDTRTLTERVRRLTLDQHGSTARQAYGAAPAGAPIIDVDRVSADRQWVFGTTAVPVPASSPATPQGALFIGRWAQGQWQVGLSGTSSFAALIARMPAAVMPAPEVGLLRRYNSVTSEQAVAATNGTRGGDGLMLPWRVGGTWTIGSADGNASSRPLGALAFWGGDGLVQAAGDGRVYRFCGGTAGSGLVMVVHPSGVASTYYRMRQVTTVRGGTPVKRGDTLGRIGTDRACGGAAAPRSLVQFSLRRGAEEVPLEGARLGGWTFRERARPLLGFAERGVMQVLPGGLLANLGAVPAEAPSAVPSLPGLPGGDDADGAGRGPAPSATQKRSSNSADAN